MIKGNATDRQPRKCNSKTRCQTSADKAATRQYRPKVFVGTQILDREQRKPDTKWHQKTNKEAFSRCKNEGNHLLHGTGKIINFYCYSSEFQKINKIILKNHVSGCGSIL